MNILKNFQISNHHKYLLYLAGILLILSLAIDVKVISNLKLAFLSLITILYGASCWIYDMNMRNRCDNINVAWQFEVSNNDSSKEKEFIEKYNPIKLSAKYGHTKIIMFIIYVVLLILGIIFVT